MAAMSAACAFAPIAPRASAARPCTSGDGSFNAATRAAVPRLLTDEAERERRHLPHFGIRVGRHHARERNDALHEPDPPDRQRRAPAHGGIALRERGEEVRHRRRDGCGGGRAAAARVGGCLGRCGRGRRRGACADLRAARSRRAIARTSEAEVRPVDAAPTHTRTRGGPSQEWRARSCVSRLCQCLHGEGGGQHAIAGRAAARRQARRPRCRGAA